MKDLSFQILDLMCEDESEDLEKENEESGKFECRMKDAIIKSKKKRMAHY